MIVGMILITLAVDANYGSCREIRASHVVATHVYLIELEVAMQSTYHDVQGRPTVSVCAPAVPARAGDSLLGLGNAGRPRSATARARGDSAATRPHAKALQVRQQRVPNFGVRGDGAAGRAGRAREQARNDKRAVPVPARGAFCLSPRGGGGALYGPMGLYESALVAKDSMCEWHVDANVGPAAITAVGDYRKCGGLLVESERGGLNRCADRAWRPEPVRGPHDRRSESATRDSEAPGRRERLRWKHKGRNTESPQSP